ARPLPPRTRLSRFRVLAAAQSRTRTTRLAREVRRLPDPRPDHEHGIQPHGRDADDRLGEADHGPAVDRLAHRSRTRHRTRSQRLQLSMKAVDAKDGRLEVLVTVLLAVAALATAWSTFQSGHWRGEQAVDTSKATAAHIESSE